MNKLSFFIIIIAFFCMFSACKKDEDKISEKEVLLTSHSWNAVSLLADGVEAGGPDELLFEFNGETFFNTDGTGQIGEYEGTWELNSNETQIIITSDELDFPLTANIIELTDDTFKIFTVFPDISTNPPGLIEIEITLIAI